MNDLTADLEAAFEQHSEEDEPIESNEEISADAGDTTEIEDVPRGTEDEGAAEGDEPKAEAAEDDKPKAGVDEEHQRETAAAAVDAKAPASWTPKAREAWAKVPPEAQAQIAKRESEVTQVLQTSATARKGMEQLNQTLAPFKDSMIQAGYADPFTAISGLLSTEKTLRTGTGQEKAFQVANLIKQFGVDIGMLDSLLAGQPVQASQNNDLEALINQRLEPVNQFLSQQKQMQQQEEYRQQQEAVQSVQAFGQEAEFLNDVRMDMADLMDAAAARGQQMSIKKAYDMACSLNPEISEMLASRKAAADLTSGRSAIERKRAAAGASLTGRPAGSGNSREGMDLRATIEDAWNNPGG